MNSTLVNYPETSPKAVQPVRQAAEDLRKPVVLLVTTDRWYPTARLGMALASVGCVVDAVCPSGHPLTKTHALRRLYSYEALYPLKSLQRAIEAAGPHLVIPGDDVATSHLHDLHTQEMLSAVGPSRLCELIEASLGSAAGFRAVHSRSILMQLAHESGIRVPATRALTSSGDLRRAISDLGFPLVLKANGTSGGVGVQIVNSVQEANTAFRKLQSAPVARAIKRALIDRDLRTLRSLFLRRTPGISAQAFISGREATSTVACWKGAVLGSLHFEVVEKARSTGHATVMKAIEHSEMSFASGTLARQLKLTGLHGLDFMLEARTGDAYLIELNPRSTQVGHLSLGPDRDLAAAIYAALSGRNIEPRSKTTERDTIALFPQEWKRDPESPHLVSGYHDVPWEEPSLVKDCMRSAHRSGFAGRFTSFPQFSRRYPALDASGAKNSCQAD